MGSWFHRKTDNKMDIRKKENKMKLNINKIGKSGYAIYFNDEFIDSFCFEANIKLENDTFELLSQTFKNPYKTHERNTFPSITLPKITTSLTNP